MHHSEGCSRLRGRLEDTSRLSVGVLVRSPSLICLSQIKKGNSMRLLIIGLSLFLASSISAAFAQTFGGYACTEDGPGHKAG